MDVNIVKKEAFSVIGKLGQGPADRGTEWIPPLWEKANGCFNEISHLAKYDQTGKIVGIWGLMSDIAQQFMRWGREGLYLAGCEVKDGSMPPQGWVLWQLPAHTFAVISCTQETYGEAFSHMLSQYLPNNGYELVGAVHEHYPQDAGQGTLELYFPIE